MNTHPGAQQTAVLIVGGGITGLSAALFLARLGIRPILVERHPTTAIMPQARAFNPRSMEIYRALGLESDIRNHQSMLVDFPEMIGADTLFGQERFRVDLLAHVRPPECLSPTDWGMIDQDELECIVRAAAESSGADVRFGTELLSFDSHDAGVTALVRELGSGAEYRVHAEYLIAADGHRAGIRNRLGIGVDHPDASGTAVFFLFDADLDAALRGRRFLLAYLDRPSTGTVLVPLRKFGRWMLGVPYQPEPGESAADFSEQRCIELVRHAVGMEDLDITLIPPVPGLPHKVSFVTGGGWVANQYRAGRVFFAGDAAHVVPPSGSFGANTGIADGHNLAWKLAAVLNGQAGDALLDTYEDERRPVAQTTLDTAMQLLHDRHQSTGDDVTKIDDLTMILGYRYRSTAILAETPASDRPVEDPRTPSGRPGFRAPHVWLHRGGTKLSTVDLFDGAFTMLVGRDSAEWTTAAEKTATALNLDVHIHHIGTDFDDLDNHFPAAYGITHTGATLVRPDGFVAWRAADLPAEPDRELLQALTRLLARGNHG
ncbi:FAD-dependent monooxygenase [Nocardia sp. NBC_01499]|uniref:FAD-dependent oxidoreductase n=1 Tax=Nocardia sp. NBC_01499 TaxID=2903597 RepID=UPI00386C09BC